MKFPMKLSAITLLVGASLLLQGCPSKDNKTNKTFSIEVTNLTNAQPFAPAGAVLHNEGYHPYVLGNQASTAIEHLAEGGDNSALLAAADADGNVTATASGSGIIAPGMSEVIQIKGLSDEFKLSLVSMLVNTNDGFIGSDAVDLDSLARNDSMTFLVGVYDAGTEANDEAGASLPGQGGEGFNATRDDRDFVAVHPGIVSISDGLTTSALDPSHRFDNPAARIVVTRIK